MVKGDALLRRLSLWQRGFESHSFRVDFVSSAFWDLILVCICSLGGMVDAVDSKSISSKSVGSSPIVGMFSVREGSFNGRTKVSKIFGVGSIPTLPVFLSLGSSIGRASDC